MSYSPENIADLNVLMQFNLASSLEGIKIHHTADPEIIAAAQRLYGRGFITLADGGYLTALGIRAAEHAQALFTLFNTETESVLESTVA